MDIKTKKVKETKIELSEVSVATFSRFEISNLILTTLASRGYNITDAKVNFETSWRYETDEWGMNPYTVVSFNGATVDLPNVKLEGDKE